jgi:serine/threonine protein kinase HipA of HipAB toxin-antitoxin module
MFQSVEPHSISYSQRVEIYPKLATSAVQGLFVGSSAGGEQPKFTVVLNDGTQIHHAIVKFSPPIRTEVGRRWADLLYAEELALTTLKEHGVLAASAEALESEERVFLQVERFDRCGARGRRGVLSLGAVDDEFVGSRENWTSSAESLRRQKRLSPRDALTITFLDSFGAWIANTDRHFGNLSLFWEFQKTPFQLAPVYDMLPMLYAPTQGHLVERSFKAPVAQYQHLDVWTEARQLAVKFWNLVSKDGRISENFRKIAQENALIVEGAGA